MPYRRQRGVCDLPAAWQYPRLPTLSLFVARLEIHDLALDGRVCILLDPFRAVVLPLVQRTSAARRAPGTLCLSIAARRSALFPALPGHLAGRPSDLFAGHHDVSPDWNDGPL